MKSAKEVFYWDASVFCAFFNAHKEQARAKVVRELLEGALAGNIDIVTSTFSIVEVIKLDGARKLPEADETKIVAFFEYPFVRLIEPDRLICEEARRLIWRFPSLFPKDSVHLASALYYAEKAHLDGLFSYDADFTRLDGKLTTQFRITEPFLSQGLLRLTATSTDGPEAGEEAIEAPDSEDLNPPPVSP